MGGLGSGGANHSGRRAVEDTATLAITMLRKRGGLRPGARTVWSWSRGGETFASIGVHGESDSVRLKYGVCEAGERSRRVEQYVAIEHRPCRFGGQRPFFLCPRCARSVLNLHLSAGRFTCRTCAQLTYACRRERARDRDLRAANKLGTRLGGEAGSLHDVAPKPKGMWRRTYARVVGEIERRETIAFEELAGWLLSREKCGRGPTGAFWA